MRSAPSPNACPGSGGPRPASPIFLGDLKNRPETRGSGLHPSLARNSGPGPAAHRHPAVSVGPSRRRGHHPATHRRLCARRNGRQRGAHHPMGKGRHRGRRPGQDRSAGQPQSGGHPRCRMPIFTPTARLLDENSWEPEDDPATRQAVAQGRTMGCFYIESPAMRLLQQKPARAISTIWSSIPASSGRRPTSLSRSISAGCTAAHGSPSTPCWTMSWRRPSASWSTRRMSPARPWPWPVSRRRCRRPAQNHVQKRARLAS